MGLFDGLSNKVQNTNTEKLLQKNIQNLESDLGKINSQKACIDTQDMQLNNKLNKCKEEIQKLEVYANQALKQGNETETNTFLTYKEKALKEKDELERKQQYSKQQLENMSNLTKHITDKIEEEKDKLRQLKMQLDLTKSQEQINKIQQGNLQEIIQERVNVAEGMTQLNGAGDTDRELEELMKKYSK